MSDQLPEGSDYQIRVDPSVPNPMAVPPPTDAAPRAPGVELQLTTLGGAAPMTWRRKITLVLAFLAALAMAVGLLSAWSLEITFRDHPSRRSLSFWDEYPVSCAVVVLIGMVSLTLLCTQRWKVLVTLLNLLSATIVGYALVSTQEDNVLFNSLGVEFGTLDPVHFIGPAWLVLGLAIFLNVVASFVQPPQEK